MKPSRFQLDSYLRPHESHTQNCCRVDHHSQHDERQTPTPAWVAQHLHRAPSSRITLFPPSWRVRFRSESGHSSNPAFNGNEVPPPLPGTSLPCVLSFRDWVLEHRFELFFE